jgi:hypothetical protein
MMLLPPLPPDNRIPLCLPAITGDTKSKTTEYITKETLKQSHHRQEITQQVTSSYTINVTFRLPL